MTTLFPVDPQYPSGFQYFPDFFTVQEETDLYNAISKIDLHPMLFQGYEAKRRVASFGYDWNFERRQLSRGKEIPHEFNWLVEKIASHIGLVKERIGELLVTEYPVGSVINWHRDAPPFDLIAGVSLLSDCTFRLKPYRKEEQNRKAIKSFTVQRRSLYIMQGEARTDWQHSTAAVKQVRYSITLRTLKEVQVP